MPLYMTQFAYTPQTWAALAKSPQNRAEVFGALASNLGGRLVSLYYTLGEYDGLVLYEAPDETTATAIVLSALAPGHLKAVKTTVALTVEQAMEAMRKAGGQTYQGPTGYGSYG